MKKKRKDFWEEMFLYPSFNIRFSITTSIIILSFLGIGAKIVPSIPNLSDQVAISNLLIQGATLVFAIVAAFFGLRQLVETRFAKLDESGLQNLRLKFYKRAIRYWKEAFYIRPEPMVFTNLCETYLLDEDFEEFDRAIKSLERGVLKDKIFEEDSERLEVLYLKALRHLLVENLGEGKKCLHELILFSRNTSALENFTWNFGDLQGSQIFSKLDGDSKKIINSLIRYLSKILSPEDKQKFEEGIYIMVDIVSPISPPIISR